MFGSYVKRVLLTLAALCVLALVAAAAPALSLRPYEPAPVDFEMAGPGKTGSASAGAASRPLRAPKRFNLVGLRLKGSEGHVDVQVRTRRSGGDWSNWTEVPVHSGDGPDPGSGEPSASSTSAPIWAGEADWVQYRLSHPVRSVRLHFVNTNGTSTARSRALTTLRRAANTAAIAVASPLASVGATEAGAATARPRIVSRASWGARHCTPRRRASRGWVKVAFVHHTVTTNRYTRAQAKQIVLAICRYHRNSNGWDDIGYSFLVDWYGTIYEGRAGGVYRAIVGAHTQGYNSGSTGIANLGDYRSRRVSTAALRSMARLIRWKLPLHGARTAGYTTLISNGGSVNRYPRGRRVRFARVSGHRNADYTTCPGWALYRQLPALRRMVGDVRPAARR